MAQKPPEQTTKSVAEIELINAIVKLLRAKTTPAAGLGIISIVEDLIRRTLVDWWQEHHDEEAPRAKDT